MRPRRTRDRRHMSIAFRGREVTPGELDLIQRILSFYKTTRAIGFGSALQRLEDERHTFTALIPARRSRV